MKTLFSPLKLRDNTLHNKIIVSPMCQYSAKDGFASDWHLVHYGQFAIGKAAAIVQEATAVTPEGRITYADLGIWSDEHIVKLKQITEFIKSQGTVPGIQLAHAGRKASCDKPWINRAQIAPNNENGWQTIAPSAIAFNEAENLPIAMDTEEIKRIIDAFRQGAERAIKAGYEIIELHGAHGYLLHQFLSPLTNLRTDEYGGTFENRIRLVLEVIEAVKSVLTTQSLWLRISATDWADGGWTLEESIELAKIVYDKGVELIDVSTGGLVRHQQIKVEVNYQVSFAEAIKQQTNILVGTVGLIKTGQQAEDILKANQADCILLGREFLRDPHFVMRAANELGVSLAWANQYERGKETL
ncbi:NADH:flavin oxidoreductase/NADH oxidase [Myroides odoratimimus]|uniref:NADH:flavin oxidoreductase/NADH oxidase n=1 Tax=Myroides TaxID=76831 RepID=UPI002578AF83|nr:MULTISPECIES: NADH:flavin oxidoreductase/NADH oxidase [Myroides]MDM1511017.1 NADH:flavin oxidoreductase/NADH oxidase [Myroides odoratimimus]MDM1524580.1 NADH:flavin oxidoreductase/NADH oxidase [Myroides odoratimimus]MDM1680824.1 NADH:flavin oxidoreductase/NADH oxidase [Myroides odoratimimus]MEC4036845.1 NADH:flavin oxidoreductase/NADH oxidase [Myroides odoratimimus]MEC4092823.1 NADH:flavin oxidoreductase/NADH oxidase [Myroides odoratimimus]